MIDAQLTLFDAPHAPASEQEIKRAELDRIEAERAELMERLRKAARHFCHRNEGLKKYRVPHTVTADDLRELEGIPVQPRLEGQGGRKVYYTNNFMGGVFRKGFVRVGFHASTTEGRHSSVVSLWTLPEYENAARQI